MGRCAIQIVMVRIDQLFMLSLFEGKTIIQIGRP